MKFNSSFPDTKNERGFSIAELVVVVTLIGILSTVSLFYFSAHRKLLKPNEQMLQIIDILQEARQKALTQRETIRVEIDLTDNVVRLVDENTTSTKTDSKIRQVSILSTSEITVETPPPDISVKPNSTMGLPDAKYKLLTTSTNQNHKAFILRFKNDGTVIDTDSKPNGAVIYVWSTKPDQTSKSDIALATSVEPSGLVRYWQYDRTLNKWINK